MTPEAVSHLFRRCFAANPDVERWAFHGHDTYGMGIANVVSAWHAGVTIFDASFGGLGGCPFAPGATGNVVTSRLGDVEIKKRDKGLYQRSLAHVNSSSNDAGGP